MFGMIKLFIQVDTTVICIIRQLIESYDQKLQIEQKEMRSISNQLLNQSEKRTVQ